MYVRTLAVLLFGILVLGGLNRVILAQEAAAEPAPAANAAAAAPQPAADAKQGPAAAKFDQVFGEFKTLLGEMGTLRKQYQEANADDRTKIREQWDQFVVKGEKLSDQLLEAAEAAYREAPNANDHVTELLVDVAIGDTQNRPRAPQTDNYDRAQRLGKLLIDNGCKSKRIYNATGIAAYVLNQLDDAEEYLKQAKENGTLNETGERYLDRIDEQKQAWEKEEKIRAAEAKADDLPRVLLKTNKGDIVIELFENEAPNTVANFVSLVNKGFYNGLTFHRVLPGFMAQGGCPTGDGTGGPDYNIPCECYKPDYRKHFQGSLSMAHAGRDTGGSQFFITFVPTDFLDGKHTVFGRVIEGMDVLPKIQRRDPQSMNPPEPDKIIEAKVLRKRDHAYEPKKTGDEFNE